MQMQNLKATVKSFGSELVFGDLNLSSAERALSIASGALLLGYGIYKRGVLGAGSMALAAALWDRGFTGHCPIYNALGVDTANGTSTDQTSADAARAEEIRAAVTIAKPAEEIFQRLRQPGELARIVSGGVAVEEASARRENIDIDLRISGEQENRRLEWTSEEGLCGSVELHPAPRARGVEVHVAIGSNPPRDWLGKAITWLSWVGSESRLRRGLRQFKQQLEAGEIPSIIGQPSGREGSDRTEPMTAAEAFSH